MRAAHKKLTHAVIFAVGECRVFATTCLPEGWQAKGPPNLSSCSDSKDY